jgi:hypothetical protein
MDESMSMLVLEVLEERFPNLHRPHEQSKQSISMDKLSFFFFGGALTLWAGQSPNWLV